MYLDGIRVLDFSRVLAGPLATQILADLGAEVLKVESPTGDDTRGWGPPFQGSMSAYFQSANRGKSSLVLDLKSAPGRRRAEHLVAVADVVVDNYLPSTRERLGLSSEKLRGVRPGLITASVVGYHGSRTEDPGYDLILQAESGLMGITGPADGEAHKVGVAVVDVLTGMMTANGILAALVRQLRTGQGASLSISLFQTALFSLINVATNHLVTGEPSRRWGNDHPNLVPYGLFRAKDRSLALGVGSDRQFEKLLAVLGLGESEIAGLNNAARVDRRGEVVAAIQRVVGGSNAQEVMEKLRAAGIPCGLVLRPDEALNASTTWFADGVIALEHGELGSIRLPAFPVVGEGIRHKPSPPPRLGQNGEEVEKEWLSVSRESTQG